jgi:hypothetical protein
VSSKVYFHDDYVILITTSKRNLKTPQTLDLEEEGWLIVVMYLLPSERTIESGFLEESAPLYLS